MRRLNVDMIDLYYLHQREAAMVTDHQFRRFMKLSQTRDAPLLISWWLSESRVGIQYRQLVRSDPGGALFVMRSTIFGKYIW